MKLSPFACFVPSRIQDNHQTPPGKSQLAAVWVGNLNKLAYYFALRKRKKAEYHKINRRDPFCVLSRTTVGSKTCSEFQNGDGLDDDDESARRTANDDDEEDGEQSKSGGLNRGRITALLARAAGRAREW